MTTIESSGQLSTSLSLFAGGDWRLESTLDGGDVPAVGAATFKFGALTLTGSITRSGEDYAGKPHIVMAGAPGWQKLITRALAFQVDSGVKLGTVLDALARGAGQQIVKPPDLTLGQYYEVAASRTGQPVRYADALNALVRDGAIATWRVDTDGVTRFTARTATAVTGRATLVRRDVGIGLAVYGTDSPATWLPGNTVDGATIGRVELHDTKKKLEAHVYEAGEKAAATLRDSIMAMVALAFEDQVRVYKVASVEADKALNLVPPANASHLPQLAKVKAWTIAGARVTPEDGTEVLVWMRRRERPIVFAFNPTVPVRVTFGADDAANAADAAYKGGTVKVLLPPLVFQGFVTGAVVGGTPQAPLPATGTLTYPGNYTLGTIETGSPNTGVSTS